MRIAFLGLGAMGSRMARHLIEADHQVTVWNRTQSATAPLVELGAASAETPAQAAEQAEIIFSMVRDDEASKDVWLTEKTGAIHAMKSDAIAVECSTLSVPYVKELAGHFNQANLTFVDAPLAGSRPQAEGKQLIFFVGADQDKFEQLQPILLNMGGAAWHAGDVGAGCVVKLMVNSLFGAQLALFGELIGFAEKSGIDPENAVKILGETPVCSPAAKLASGAMIKGMWAPAFPIDLVAKDFDLVAKSAEDVNAEIAISNATGAVFKKAVEDGFAGDNITGIVQRYWTPKKSD